MKKLLMIAVLAMATALPSRAAWAQALPAGAEDLGDNAALKYWFAFAVMPSLTDAEDKIVGHWREAPLDNAAGAVVAKSENALKLLQKAAQFRRCDWGLDKEGPDTLMPHLAKARQIARLACLRIRYRASKGDSEGAVKDLLAAFTLSRHCNADGCLISLLVRLAIEQVVTDGASDTLTRLDHDQLKKLAAGLAALPEGHGLRQALLSESEDMLGWKANWLKRGGTKAGEEFRNMLQEEAGETKAPGKKPVTAEDVTRYVQDLETGQRYYTLAAGMSALPPAEFEAQSKALAAKMKKECPTVPQIFDLDLSRFRYQEANSEARMAMLKAAIAVVLDGPDRVKSFKDPSGDGPFEYSPIGNGFQLKSKLVYMDKPVTLTVLGQP